MHLIQLCRRLPRLFKMFASAYRFGLADFLSPQSEPPTHNSVVLYLRHFRSRRYSGYSRESRLRLALEDLGPIFVKFGQALSTRRDLFPEALVDELALLQDQVSPFPHHQVQMVLKTAYRRPLNQVFKTFEDSPLASASVAQVHQATLLDDTPVAVKILRPNIRGVIEQDLFWMKELAKTLERWWPEGRRLRLSAVVDEFQKHLLNELDLLREAAHCTHLRQNFANSTLLKVPQVYWDYCTSEVMVMELMQGTPISQIATLKAQQIDLKKLSRDGVTTFFTQVFRDSFFHADMHPGNILVAADGRYIALDFGIMGTLNEQDKNYLAQNFLAFFRRDYRGVAIAHIQSGWAPPETNLEELETAIRAISEPIFAKPLKDISLGKLLLRLFQTGRRFNIEIQPQLVLLQKTLLQIEGLGRELDPDLDLWQTAQPFLERWMQDRVGWGAFLKHCQEEYPYWLQQLPQLPRKLAQIETSLARLPSAESMQSLVNTLLSLERKRQRYRSLLLILLTFIAVALWWR